MLVTSQFVVLNLPKTGSSFVREVLKAIYNKRRWKWGADRMLKEFMLPRLGGGVPGVDQHGTFRQIPPRFKHLPVVAAVRNPYSKLLSAYEYRWWAQNPLLPKEELTRRFPHFPELSLDEFVEMWELTALRRLGGSNPLGLGRQTVQFFNFFFRDPPKALASLSDDYVETGAFRDDMAEVTFLKQEKLRDDLAAFLERFGFSPEELEICRRYRSVNKTKGGVSDRSTLWTPNALQSVETSERFMLRMLDHLGISYQPPSPPAS